MSRPDYKKITQVLNYIAEKEGGKVNYMKALKLLYLADRLHLRKYGRLITDDLLLAMKNGTLGSQARDIVKLKKNSLPYEAYKYSESKLKRNKEGEYIIETSYTGKESLSETDIECIDKVISIVGDKGEFDLGELTHDLPEWKRHQFLIEKGEKKVVTIRKTDLFDDTDNSLLKEIYSQSKDELSLAKELFLESVGQDKYLS